jgi:hypothetical protein
MPAKDLFHNTVKNALIKDGWTITHDPLTLDLRDRQLHIALGAEKLLDAQKDNQQIAVEIKSFVAPSNVASEAATTDSLSGSSNRDL